MNDADVVVVGAGHNGLIAAAYLARAGLDTLVLEARAGIGGCAATDEDLGARFNVCNCDHSLIRATPIPDELGLSAHGLRYLELDPALVCVHWDGGPAWSLHADPGRTVDGLRATYPGEVEGYTRYLAAGRPVAELALELATVVPTARSVLRRLLERRARGVGTMLRWQRFTAAQVLSDFFATEQLRAPAITTGPAVWGLSPFTARTGLGAIGYALKHVVPPGRPAGGSGSLPGAVAAALVAAGGQIRTGAPVDAIECDAGRVRAVRLADGVTVESPVVVVACDPRRAFVEWLRSPPAGAAATIECWRGRARRDGYESKLDAVVREPIRLAGTDAGGSTIAVSPTLAAIDAGHRAMRRGAVADRPMFLVNTPSLLDPSVVPAGGGHVLSVEVLHTPYALRDGWPGSREPERWLDVLAGFAQPGWRASVDRWRAVTPDRYEADLNLPRGYATSFGGSPLSALAGRDPELTRYRTPVPGLYLTGAATYPGAGIWGASGRNCAHVVLADL